MHRESGEQEKTLPFDVVYATRSRETTTRLINYARLCLNDCLSRSRSLYLPSHSDSSHVLAATCFSLVSFVALNEFYVHFTSADFRQRATPTAPIHPSDTIPSNAPAINLHFSAEDQSTTLPQ